MRDRLQRRAPGFGVPTWVFACLLFLLSACGGSGGGSETGRDSAGFSVPRDGLLHAVAILAMSIGPEDAFAADLAGSYCVDGGSRTSDPITVFSYYASGEINGSLTDYSGCVDGDVEVIGNRLLAQSTSGDVAYARLGSPCDGSGCISVPLSRQESGVVVERLGIVELCRDCALVGGVAADEMRLNMNVRARSDSRTRIYRVRRGSDEAPFVARWREDYPSSGQALIWFEGSSSFQGPEDKCDLPRVEYRTPDETRALTTSDSGAAPADSGLLRMELNGTTADAVFDPSGLTLTVNGVSETFTWEQAWTAWNEGGCALVS